jgi:putative phosphoribosyl transferase
VLAGRLHAAAAWLGTEPLTASLPLGLFGASTGAAAALRLAADSGSGIAAAVSRGGVLTSRATRWVRSWR